MDQKRIAFIIPYFGKFNNYFEVWLHTCRFNPTIDWIIFTDDKTAYNYPENVKVHYTTFGETKALMQSKFDFPIELKSPYLLCEFRLAFGEIYSDYLSGYDFWGFCDNDLIWGNLRRHITDEILNEYSKISWRGHLTLFKNDDRINRLYRNQIDGIDFYKYALSNDTGFPLASDEREVNYIFDQEGEKIYKGLVFADLKIRSFNFQLLHFAETEQYKNAQQVFYWDKGELYRMYIHNGAIMRENFAYVHFLKRPMAVEGKFDDKKNILIVPNKLISTDEPPSKTDIEKFSVQKVYWSYIISKISLGYLKTKIKYYKSRKQFREKYSFLPLKKTHVEMPAPLSEKLSAQ